MLNRIDVSTTFCVAIIQAGILWRKVAWDIRKVGGPFHFLIGHGAIRQTRMVQSAFPGLRRMRT